jgi:hypothetical protein
MDEVEILSADVGAQRGASIQSGQPVGTGEKTKLWRR